MSVSWSPTSVQVAGIGFAGGDGLLEEVGAGFEQVRVRACAGDNGADLAIEGVAGEVGADGTVGVVADHGQGAAGVAATGDDGVDAGGGLGGRDGGYFEVGHGDFDFGAQVWADAGRVG